SRPRKSRPISLQPTSKWSAAERNGRRGAPSQAGTCGVPAISPPAKSSSRSDAVKSSHAAIQPPPPHLPRDHAAADRARPCVPLRSHRLAASHRDVRWLLPLGRGSLLVHRLLSRPPEASSARPHRARRHHRDRIPQARSVPSTRPHPPHILRQSHPWPLLLLHRHRRLLVRSSLLCVA